MRRIGRRILDTLVLGPATARDTYFARSPSPLDPKETWDRVRTRAGPLLEWLRRNYPPDFLLRLSLFYYRKTRAFRDHELGINQHYDISNQFYQLFLDERYMLYSCADFTKETETLEEAQENKARFILDLLDPQPGEKVLDLGCGYGGMLEAIYARTGDKENLCGYTLSKEQKKLIEDRYGFHVEYKDFITTEYDPESIDKIFSVGAMEHVRPGELAPLANKLARALRPNGRIIHHFFCQMRDLPPRSLLGGGNRIFPGSELSSLKRHLDAFEAAGLKVKHHSIHDYRPTLRAWFERLAANTEAAIEAAGMENYNAYLCFFARSWRLFDDRDLIVMCFALERA